MEQQEPLNPSVPQSSPAVRHALRLAQVPSPPPGRSQKPLQHCASSRHASPPPRHAAGGAHTQPDIPSQSAPPVSTQLPLQHPAAAVQPAPTVAQPEGTGTHTSPSQRAEQQSPPASHATPFAAHAPSAQRPSSQRPSQQSAISSHAPPRPTHIGTSPSGVVPSATAPSATSPSAGPSEPPQSQPASASPSVRACRKREVRIGGE